MLQVMHSVCCIFYLLEKKRSLFGTCPCTHVSRVSLGFPGSDRWIQVLVLPTTKRWTPVGNEKRSGVGNLVPSPGPAAVGECLGPTHVVREVAWLQGANRP